MVERAQTIYQTLVRRLLAFLTDKRSKVAFLTVGVCSIFAYLYYTNNLIHNNDMISCTPWGAGSSITSGRWGLYLLAGAMEVLWGGHYNLPAFNVLLALVIMGVAAALLIRTLRIRRTSLCVCISAITVTIPAFATLMFFAYSIQYYALSILLTVVAAYLLQKKGFVPFITGAFCFCLSLSIYQAYLPFFAVLLLLTLIARCLNTESTAKELMLTAVKYGAAMVLSYVLYRLFLEGLLWALHLELSSYQSINTMGTIHLSGVVTALKELFLLPFCSNYHGFSSTIVIRAGIAVSFLSAVVALVGSKKMPLAKVALLVGFLALLLIAVNSTHILTGDSALYTRMTLGLIGIFYLPVVLLDGVNFRSKAVKSSLLGVMVCTLLLCSANYAWQSNGNYLSEQYANEKVENFYVTMFTRIRSAEGYKDELPVVYVGQNITDVALWDNWGLPAFKYTAIIGATAQLNQYSRDQYIINYLGYRWRPITEAEAETYAETINGLQCYPDDGSIVVTEDMVIIRLE